MALGKLVATRGVAMVAQLEAVLLVARVARGEAALAKEATVTETVAMEMVAVMVVMAKARVVRVEPKEAVVGTEAHRTAHVEDTMAVAAKAMEQMAVQR